MIMLVYLVPQALLVTSYPNLIKKFRFILIAVAPGPTQQPCLGLNPLPKTDFCLSWKHSLVMFYTIVNWTPSRFYVYKLIFRLTVV